MGNKWEKLCFNVTRSAGVHWHFIQIRTFFVKKKKYMCYIIDFDRIKTISLCAFFFLLNRNSCAVFFRLMMLWLKTLNWGNANLFNGFILKLRIVWGKVLGFWYVVRFENLTNFISREFKIVTWFMHAALSSGNDLNVAFNK